MGGRAVQNQKYTKNVFLSEVGFALGSYLRTPFELWELIITSDFDMSQELKSEEFS